MSLAVCFQVYAAQPREGTETWHYPCRIEIIIMVGLCSSTPRGDGNYVSLPCLPLCNRLWFMQLNPARGRKRPNPFSAWSARMIARVYAAQPREGTETRRSWTSHLRRGLPGLCSSTPRGDGNAGAAIRFSEYHSRFMQLNPARGRKLEML